MIAAFVMIVVAGCATVPKEGGALSPSMTAGGGVTNATTGTAGTAYKFGPDDVVRVIVEDHPEWTGEFVVKPEGLIVIPTLGEVHAAGSSKKELEDHLRERMEKYIRNPRVNVDIVKYISQVIYVLGEVNRPGEYSTAGKTMTLRDAIVMAGLPARFAVTTRVFVINPRDNERPPQQVINLYRVLYRGETERNIVLRPGDIVYVPKSLIGKVSDFLSTLLSPASSVRTVVTPLP